MNKLTLKNDVNIEFTEKKSRFIGHAFYVADENDVILKINEIKQKYNDASHNVFAYVLGDRGQQRFSDDNEPSQTAGMPVLNVLNQKKLVNSCVVVTRYFGGILLGAGGLTRAYSKAAAMSVEKAEMTEIVSFVNFEMVYPYEIHNTMLKKFASNKIELKDQDFTDVVTINAVTEKNNMIVFKDSISELFNFNIILQEHAEFFDRLK